MSLTDEHVAFQRDAIGKQKADRVRLISDGTFPGSTLWIGDQFIPGVTKLTLTIDADTMMASATVEIELVMVDYDGPADITQSQAKRELPPDNTWAKHEADRG